MFTKLMRTWITFLKNAVAIYYQCLKVKSNYDHCSQNYNNKIIEN